MVRRVYSTFNKTKNSKTDTYFRRLIITYLVIFDSNISKQGQGVKKLVTKKYSFKDKASFHELIF